MPYLAPTCLSDAVQIMTDAQPRIIAGCTDYFPSQAQGHIPETLLDITRVAELQGITRTPDGWRIGAAATWTDLIRAELPPAFDALKLAAHEVGSVQIQNRATLVGNICNASPAADGVPPLLALDALVELTSATGTRQTPLAAFITGVRQTTRGAGEMVTGLVVPSIGPSASSDFVKLGSRTHLVISIAMVAVVLDIKDAHLTHAAIAVGSCAPVAQRLHALEAYVTGYPIATLPKVQISPDMLTPLSPISDVRGSQQYRLDVVGPLIQRALARAAKG